MTNQEHLVRHTTEEIDEMLRHGQDQTDWRRLDAMTEEQIEAAIDHEDEGEFDWSQASVEMPTPKKQMTVRFDLDVVEWFRAKGPGYQTRMNQVLRSYVDAHRRK